MAMCARALSISPKNHACAGCSLTGECLAKNADPGGDDRLDIAVVPRVYRKGEHVFRAGETFTAIYMVRSGAVKTYVLSPAGEEQVVGFHYPGDFIGADGLSESTHTTHAAALDSASLCTLPYDKLARLCQHSRSVYDRLLKGMSRRIKAEEDLLLLLGQKSAEQRIAALLLGISEAQRRRGYSGAELSLPMPRADIGSYLSLAVETVSRVLTRLQKAGTVCVQRSQVRILDRAALAQIANGSAEDTPL